MCISDLSSDVCASYLWSCRHHRRRAGHSHPCPDATAASRCPETVELTGREYKGLRPPLVVLDLASRNLSRSGVLGNPSDLDRAKAPSQVLPRPTFPADRKRVV